MNKEEQGIEIDLIQILRVLLNNLKYIVLVTVIFGVLGYLGSSIFMTPIYEAGAKMIVNSRKEESQSITNDQLNSAKNLLDTYAVIICSRDVLNQVIDELNLPESYEQLLSRINVQAVNDTQVMQISVEHESKETALAVTEKILEIAPSAIGESIVAGSVKPVEKAYANPNPVSPNITKNTVFTAIIGFMLSCAVFFIVFLLDNTYETNTDIQKDFDIPVLGVIPAVESCIGYSKHRENGGEENNALKEKNNND